MLIGEVGNTFSTTIKINYRSDRTFIDFDMLVLNYLSILNSQASNHGKFYLNRKQAVKEFIDYKKKPLIIFTPDPFDIFFKLPNAENTASFSDILPIEKFITTKESGNAINIIQNSAFTLFFEKYVKHFQYSSFFTEFSGIPLLETPHTKKVISFINNNSLFLPQLKSLPLEANFFSDLYEIISGLRPEMGAKQLPDWSSNYILPNEDKLIEDVTRLKEELNIITNKIQDKELELSNLIRNKFVITESGTALEIEVKKILIEIGFEILDTEISRDDLIVKLNHHVAVVEIKGTKGTSAEKHSAQLEKWVSTYYERLNIMPKGILIVNTYKDIEISDRPFESFPHQMLKYATQREHCMLSTIQLLGLYLEIKNDTSKKDELIDDLFNTAGVYSKFSNWNDFFTKKN